MIVTIQMIVAMAARSAPNIFQQRLRMLEPLVALALGLHGVAMSLARSGGAIQWVAIGGVLLLGILGVAGWRGSERIMLFRAGMLIVLTWILLSVTGGTGSVFMPWLFPIVAVYSMLLLPVQGIVFLTVVIIGYLLLLLFIDSAMPATVVLGRGLIIVFVGGFLLILAQIIRGEVQERRHAEEMLERERAVFQIALDATKTGVWNWDIKANRIEWSHNLAQLYQVSVEHFDKTYEGYLDLIHPEDRETVRQAVQAALESQGVFIVAHRPRLAELSQRWLEIQGHVLLGEDQQPTRMVGTVHDITARRKEDAARRKNEARLAEAQRIAHLGNWEWDLEDETQYWSEELYRIYGIDPKEEHGSYQTFLSRVHPDDRPWVIQRTEAALKNYEKVTLEFRVCPDENTVRTVWSEGQIILDRQGRPVRMAGTVLDVTERKQAEKAVQKAQEALLAQQQAETEHVEQELLRVKDTLVRQTRLATIGQMSASVAHELRTPLGTIRNAVYFLRRQVPSGDVLWTKYLDIIEKEIDASTQIITDLLEMSRAKELVREEVRLDEALQDALRHVSGIAEATFEYSFEPEPFVFSVDPGQFRQVLINLLSNAIEAVQGQGRIAVRARRSADHDIITIQDDGVGVQSDLRDRIFDPLFTTRAKGTGLGLAICRQIVERHGGSLELVQTGEPGAAFRIELPRT